MRSFALIALALAACAHTPARKSVGTPALDGHWQLADVRCASGALGELGQRIVVPVHERTLDESYEVENGAFTWRVRERARGGVEEQYCETVMTGSGYADGKILRSSSTKLESRKGVGGYQCYDLVRKPKTEASRDYQYELGGGRLMIHHKNPKAAVQDEKGKLREIAGCEDGSDLLYVFERN